MSDNTHSLRPFRNPSYIDYLVGWKYLLNKHYRAVVHSRWEEQPRFISAAEIISGIGSILFSSALGAILIFIVWDTWFK
jgi:hypothetical protein